MSADRQQLGQAGEELAARFLSQRGHIILARNSRKKFGEIDIISRNGQTLVFTEVKTRRSQLYGTAAQAVTLRKQQQIARVAEEYLIEKQLVDCPARFDVIGVDIASSGAANCTLIENAFELPNW